MYQTPRIELLRRRLSGDAVYRCRRAGIPPIAPAESLIPFPRASSELSRQRAADCVAFAGPHIQRLEGGGRLPKSPAGPASGRGGGQADAAMLPFIAVHSVRNCSRQSDIEHSTHFGAGTVRPLPARGVSAPAVEGRRRRQRERASTLALIFERGDSNARISTVFHNRRRQGRQKT
jgi:hypothetical protein